MRLPPLQTSSESPPDEAWDEEDRREIVAYIPIGWEACLAYEKEKAQIEDACCCCVLSDLYPFRWLDAENALKANHLALSNEHVMFLTEKHSVHVLNPCPPCCCCSEGSYREDFKPKTRKLIPFEKITDVEVQEAGSNELVTPTCCCCQCPPSCNPVSVDLPVSKTLISTAGSQGPELVLFGVTDANAFRRKILDSKRGGPAPRQQAMESASLGEVGPARASLGGVGPALVERIVELTTLVKDIAESNRELVRSNLEISERLVPAAADRA